MKERIREQGHLQNPQSEGSVSEWDRIWATGSEDMETKACLFWPGRPRTIYEFWQQSYANDLVRFCAQRSYRDFLELGCGRATTSMYLSWKSDREIGLVDLSSEALHRARTNFIRFGLNAPAMYLKDVRNTGLPSASFDCIYNIGLLEHFENPQPVLNEAFRLLKPGGAVFMPIFPERTPVWSYVLRLLFNPVSFLKMIIFGTQQATRKDMIRTSTGANDYMEMAHNSGFSEISCKYYNPFPKIIRDSWYENHVILPVYRILYHLFCKRNQLLSLQTGSFFGIGYVLLAIKPADFKIKEH